MSGHPTVVPFQFFATADGHIAIATPKEKFFRALVDGMGLPELVDDRRFIDFEARGRHRDSLLPILSARFAERSTADWLTALRGRIPIAPVRSLEEALELSELRARGMSAEYDHPQFGSVRSVGLPLAMSGYEPTYRPGPPLDGDRGGILAELGYDDDSIERLRADGAFGSGIGPVHQDVEPA